MKVKLLKRLRRDFLIGYKRGIYHAIGKKRLQVLKSYVMYDFLVKDMMHLSLGLLPAWAVIVWHERRKVRRLKK